MMMWTWLSVLGCTEAAGPVKARASAAPAARSAASSALVHIYVPVGALRSGASCEVHAARLAGAVSCDVQRLVWDPATGGITAGTVVATAAISPTVSPSGERLAVVRTQSRRDQIYIVDLQDGSESRAETGLQQSKFPRWLSDEQLLLSSPVTGARCLGDSGRCERLPHWNQLYVYDVPSRRAEVYASSVERSFADPSAHPSASLVAAHGARLSDGVAPVCDPSSRDSAPRCSDVPSGMPVVLEPSSGRMWQHQLQTMRGTTPVPLAGCAHVSWSPEGDMLLCTEQKTRALLRAGVGNQVYAVPFSSDQPTGVRPLTVEPLFSHSQNPFDGGSCPKLVHKQVEFCGDRNHVVATVGCTARGPETTARYSRVYLIDVTDSASPQYTDLTAVIEAARGEEPGALRGFSATCAIPRTEAQRIWQ